MFSALLARRQSRLPLVTIALASCIAAATIAALGLLGDALDRPLLIAAFGASCVLVFTFPESPLSSPINVIGGHVVSALCGLLVCLFLPAAWWSMALGVGLALAAMAMLRVTHPPAGGTPIVIVLTQEGWTYLLAPVLAGAVVVALGGSLYRLLRARAEAGRAARRPLAGFKGSAGAP